jgi:hypothetical protein
MPPPSNVAKSEFKKKKSSAEGKKEKFSDDVGDGKGKGKKKKDSEDLASHEKVIDTLLRDMKQALEEDYESNKNKKPAFKRLKLLKTIDSHMRNTNLHGMFIDKEGLKYFNAWLSQMPDGSYPNQKIVATILQCLDLIEVNDEDRDEL